MFILHSFDVHFKDISVIEKRQQITTISWYHRYAMIAFLLFNVVTVELPELDIEEAGYELQL